MTLDFFLSQLRALLLATVAYLAGRGVFTPVDASFAAVVVTSVLPIVGPYLWTLFSNFGVVKVNTGSVAAQVAAIEPTASPSKIMSTVQSAVLDAKPMAVILFALMIVLAPSVGFAQGKLTFGTPNTPALSPLNAIAQWADDDIKAAIELSTAIPSLQDTVGKACWETWSGAAEVIKKHPLPLTLKLASDIQAARLVFMALKNVCLKPECSQVWNDLQNQVSALSILPLPVQIASVCSRIR